MQNVQNSLSLLCQPITKRGLHIATSTVAAVALIIFVVSPVHANQSPPSCNANRLNVSIIKDKTSVFQGDTITYSVTVSNVNFAGDIACDITNTTVQLHLPAADGTPTGAIVTLATGVNYPAGTSPVVVGSAPYVVQVNPGVVDIVAEVSANGTLHDAPVDHSALIVKTLGTSVETLPPSGSGGVTSTPASTTTTVPKLPNTGSLREL